MPDPNHTTIWIFVVAVIISLFCGMAVGALFSRRTGVNGLNRSTHLHARQPRRQVNRATQRILVAPSLTTVITIGPSEPILVEPIREEILTIGPSTDQPIVVRPSETAIIEPPQRGAWDERGWIRSRNNGTNQYEGFYEIQTRTGQVRRFQGRVVVDRVVAVPYIAEPPPEIRRHPKGPCFMLVAAPWFKVNWANPAHNVDDAILYVEKSWMRL